MTHVLATERWRAEAAGRAASNARSLAYFCAPLPDSKIQSALNTARGPLKKFANEIRGAGGRRAALAGLDARARQTFARFARENRYKVELSASDLQELAQLVQALASASKADQDSVQGWLEKNAVETKVVVGLNQLFEKEMQPVWPETPNAMWLTIVGRVQANFEGSDRYTLSEPGFISHRISPLDRSVENMTIAGDWTACGLDVGCVEAAVMSGMLASHAISRQPDLEKIIGYDHP